MKSGRIRKKGNVPTTARNQARRKIGGEKPQGSERPGFHFKERRAQTTLAKRKRLRGREPLTQSMVSIFHFEGECYHRRRGKKKKREVMLSIRGYLSLRKQGKSAVAQDVKKGTRLSQKNRLPDAQKKRRQFADRRRRRRCRVLLHGRGAKKPSAAEGLQGGRGTQDREREGKGAFLSWKTRKKTFR